MFGVSLKEVSNEGTGHKAKFNWFILDWACWGGNRLASNAGKPLNIGSHGR